MKTCECSESSKEIAWFSHSEEVQKEIIEKSLCECCLKPINHSESDDDYILKMNRSEED